MPVFGRRRTGVRTKSPTYFTAKNSEGMVKHYEYGKLEHVVSRRGRTARRETRIEREFPYLYLATPLSNRQYSVRSQLGFDVLRYARQLAKKGPINVLDWGAAKGVAATELAQNGGKNVNVFAYGDILFPELLANPHVTSIQGHGRDLFRFFKKPSFNIVYSTMGLAYLARENSTEVARDYIRRLTDILRPGGLLVFGTTVNPIYYGWARNQSIATEWAPVLRELHFIPELTVWSRGPTIFIQRKTA